MIKRNNLTQTALLCFILSMLFLPVANAGLVEVYMNGSKEDLVVAEVDSSIPYGADIVLEFYIKGVYMYSDDADDEELSIYNINIDVIFLSDEDSRDACRACAAPRYIEPKANEIRDYDVYEAKFYSDSADFDGYKGDIRFNIVMSNKTSTVITGAGTTIQLTIDEAAAKETSSGFTLPELPAPIMDNLVMIIVGLVGIILLSFGIYTFVLAPEDTTASLYKTKESVNPLSKSLTGVGYDSELPSESKLKRLEDSKADSDDEEDEVEDDEEYEDYDDDEEDEDFDESELLAKLTGGATLKDTKDKGDKEEPKAAPKKKAIKKTVAKKSITKKKVVRKAAPPKTDDSDVNMGKGIKNITCPSCETVHHIDENTPKFICSCGRRIRV